MHDKVKRHLEGGTLRKVMAAEIKRVMAKYAGQLSAVEQAADELGVTARTLRVWRGPLAKGGWSELQPPKVVETFLGRTKKEAAKPRRAKI